MPEKLRRKFEKQQQRVQRLAYPIPPGLASRSSTAPGSQLSRRSSAPGALRRPSNPWPRPSRP
eukprot:7136694-Karenia_brevis.AAC.1